jgi:hypothetical protein
MPYIASSRRRSLDPLIDRLALAIEKNGELNYAITQLIRTYFNPLDKYDTHAAALGVLESLKLEFYRRATAPYEDQKIQENGDVYYGRPPVG